MSAPLWTFRAEGGAPAAARALVRRLLESSAVDLVVVQLPQPRTGRLVHALVREPALLAEASPLSPVMPVNGARMISRLASSEPGRRIAAVLRPCEERALVELVKLNQARLDDLLLVVVDCPGAVERDERDRLAAGPDGLDGASQAVLAAAFEPGAPGPALRPACRICDRFVPGALADLSVELFGHPSALGVRLSERAAGMVDPPALGLEQAEAEPEERPRLVSALAAIRGEELRRQLDRLSGLRAEVGRLLDEIGACVRCGGCQQACPICFCRRCTFEMPAHEHEPRDYLRWAERKGAVRLPEDPLLYHLTRLAHVALSCAGCGACESACPQGVRLTRLFAHVGAAVREPFGYVPGRSTSEPLPLSVFEREELEPR